MTAKQKGLGRGLDSLISSNTKIYDQSPNNIQKNISEVFTDNIVTSPWQPRNIFDKDGDGVVTDEEMALEREMMRAENENKKEKGELEVFNL